MLGSVAGRNRRPLWVGLSFLLAAGIGAGFFLAGEARGRLTDEAAGVAGTAALTRLAPLLEEKDLELPITGERYEEVSAGIRERLTAVGPVTHVTIWSSLGRVLYSDDPSLVGTHPSSVRDLVYSVANGTDESRVESGVLKTYVPVWVQPGGAVAVAEMDQPYGPIAARANLTWYRLALGLGGLLVLSVTMLGLTYRRTTPSEPTFGTAASTTKATAGATLPPVVPEPVPPADTSSRASASDDPNSPMYMHPGFRELEEARQVAEDHARAVEQRFRDLQVQHTRALEQIKLLETRIEVRDKTSSGVEEEVRALRDQVRDSTERLERAQVDEGALRERLSFQTSQLDQAQGAIQSANETVKKLERELEAAHAELGPLRSRVHITKLSEALQDLSAEPADAEVVEAAEVVVDAEERSPRVIIGRSTTPAGPPSSAGRTA